MSHDTPLTDDEKIALAKAELELLREEGIVELPSEVNEQQWKELIAVNSILGRRSHFRFLYITEMRSKQDQIKKLDRQINREKVHEEYNASVVTESHITYGLWKNAINIKFTDQYIDNVYNHRLITSKKFGQPIIFDNSFGKYMKNSEKKNLGQQLAMCYGLNRLYEDPFYFHMFNVDPKEDTTGHLLKVMPKILDNDFLIDVHSNNYLDHFPREKLVYLAQNCRHDMGKFDHDAVYIIGSLIDTSGQDPVVLAKAKKEGIRVQRLPFDRHVAISLQSTILIAVVIFFDILLPLRYSGTDISM